MKKEKINLQELTLVGLSVRTNNKNEMNPETAKIGAIAGGYWKNQTANAIRHRLTPGVTYAVYTDFDSDEHGEYTYFIGEKVSSTDDQDQTQFTSITAPKSAYQKFTTNPGNMPNVVITAWQAIWQMDQTDFEGKRRYQADFEIYDERASDPSDAVVDIYIGIDV